MNESNFDRFMHTYNGQKLAEKFSMNQEGLWQVYGEDPNCDFGGHHHQPNLGVYQGTLWDVIHTAVELPNFWQWGGGGDIVPVSVKKADAATNRRREEIQAKLTKLKLELTQLENDLAALN